MVPIPSAKTIHIQFILYLTQHKQIYIEHIVQQYFCSEKSNSNRKLTKKNGYTKRFGTKRICWYNYNNINPLTGDLLQHRMF